MGGSGRRVWPTIALCQITVQPRIIAISLTGRKPIDTWTHLDVPIHPDPLCSHWVEYTCSAGRCIARLKSFFHGHDPWRQGFGLCWGPLTCAHPRSNASRHQTRRHRTVTRVCSVRSGSDLRSKRRTKHSLQLLTTVHRQQCHWSARVTFHDQPTVCAYSSHVVFRTTSPSIKSALRIGNTNQPKEMKYGLAWCITMPIISVTVLATRVLDQNSRKS